jgi:hypothetical protein
LTATATASIFTTAIQWGEDQSLRSWLSYCPALNVPVTFLVSVDFSHIVVEQFSVRRMIIPEPVELLGNFVGRPGSADPVETVDFWPNSKETRTCGYDRQQADCSAAMKAIECLKAKSNKPKAKLLSRVLNSVGLTGSISRDSYTPHRFRSEREESLGFWLREHFIRRRVNYRRIHVQVLARRKSPVLREVIFGLTR